MKLLHPLIFKNYLYYDYLPCMYVQHINNINVIKLLIEFVVYQNQIHKEIQRSNNSDVINLLMEYKDISHNNALLIMCKFNKITEVKHMAHAGATKFNEGLIAAFIYMRFIANISKIKKLIVAGVNNFAEGLIAAQTGNYDTAVKYMKAK